MVAYSNKFIRAQRSFVAYGDSADLEALFQEYSGLYDYLCRTTKDEDTAQKALTQAAKKLTEAPYEGDESLFEGWLYRCAVDASRELGEVHPPGEQTPKALQDLPTDLLEAFLLAHYAKLTTEQIGVALRVTAQEAAAQIERAVLLVQGTDESSTHQ
jgi:DNA-directed RNA polymerase specialized sigma24 family protein